MPRALQAALELLDPVAQVGDGLAQQPGPIEAFFFWIPLKISSFWGHSVNDSEQHPNEENVASKIQRDTRDLVPLSWL